MKRLIKRFTLMLVAAMLLCTTTFAANVEGTWAKLTDKISGNGTTATFSLDETEKFINMEVTGTSIQAGGQYVVLMVKGTEDNYTVTSDNILYIDQTEAAGASEGTIQFKIYPSSIQDSVILISGSTIDDPIVAAVVKAKDGQEGGGSGTPANPSTPGGSGGSSGGGGSSSGGGSSGGSIGGTGSGNTTPSTPDIPNTPDTPNTPWGNPFTDVSEDDWFYDDVAYVVENGLMTGVGGQFNPGGTTTRGMIMTILARLAGTDTSGGDPWYQPGMEWAMQAGVSDGTGPEADITREQFVTMLWRYAGEPAATGSLSAYSDAANVNDWARDAMTWAIENGIIYGTDGNKIDPQGSVSAGDKM